jgi:hypothetical protein
MLQALNSFHRNRLKIILQKLPLYPFAFLVRFLRNKPASKQVTSAGAQTHASLATWNENQGTPQKAVGALAVFNDHVGCAEIKELPPMQLCFDIQDDVSSLTLASGQMSVDGLSSVADLSCISDTRFLGAKKNGNSGFTVSYQLSPTDDVRCKSEGGVLNLTINAV